MAHPNSRLKPWRWSMATVLDSQFASITSESLLDLASSVRSIKKISRIGFTLIENGHAQVFGYGENGLQVRDCLHPDDLARIVLAQIIAGSATGRPSILQG